MLRHARKIHLTLGLLGFLIFLFTGYYMRHRIPDLMQADERLRFSLRGNHIYILLSALLNLALGSHFRASKERWRATTQVIGSLLIVTSTALLVAAFFYEPKSEPERPVTLWAMIAALAGTAGHALSRIKEGVGSDERREPAKAFAQSASGGSSGFRN